MIPNHPTKSPIITATGQHELGALSGIWLAVLHVVRAISNRCYVLLYMKSKSKSSASVEGAEAMTFTVSAS